MHNAAWRYSVCSNDSAWRRERALRLAPTDGRARAYRAAVNAFLPVHLAPLSTNVVASTPETVPFDEKRPDSFSFSPTLPLWGRPDRVVAGRRERPIRGRDLRARELDRNRRATTRAVERNVRHCGLGQLPVSDSQRDRVFGAGSGKRALVGAGLGLDSGAGDGRGSGEPERAHRGEREEASGHRPIRSDRPGPCREPGRRAQLSAGITSPASRSSCCCVVDERVEQNQLGARVRDRADTSRAVSGGPAKMCSDQPPRP